MSVCIWQMGSCAIEYKYFYFHFSVVSSPLILISNVNIIVMRLRSISECIPIPIPTRKIRKDQSSRVSIEAIIIIRIKNFFVGRGCMWMWEFSQKYGEQWLSRAWYRKWNQKIVEVLCTNTYGYMVYGIWWFCAHTYVNIKWIVLQKNW